MLVLKFAILFFGPLVLHLQDLAEDQSDTDQKERSRANIHYHPFGDRMKVYHHAEEIFPEGYKIELQYRKTKSRSFFTKKPSKQTIQDPRWLCDRFLDALNTRDFYDLAEVSVNIQGFTCSGEFWPSELSKHTLPSHIYHGPNGDPN
jgi:hypothetical protein